MRNIMKKNKPIKKRNYQPDNTITDELLKVQTCEKCAFALCVEWYQTDYTNKKNLPSYWDKQLINFVSTKTLERGLHIQTKGGIH